MLGDMLSFLAVKAGERPQPKKRQLHTLWE